MICSDKTTYDAQDADGHDRVLNVDHYDGDPDNEGMKKSHLESRSWNKASSS